jgi:hypothetical protein
MFVMNLGFSPHFKQRGEVGFWRSCFSMPHGMPARPSWQVKKRRHYWGDFSSPFSQPVGRAGLMCRGQGSHERGRQLRRPAQTRHYKLSCCCCLYFDWGTKINPLSLEPLSAASICSLSKLREGHHDENSLSDGRYSRIRGTFIRAAGQNYRSSAAIRCFLVLRGSRYRDDEMSSCQYPACRWRQHEGYRCCSFDTRISGNSLDG